MFDQITTAVYRAWLQKWKSDPYLLRRYRSGDVTTISFRVVLQCWAVSTSQLQNSSVCTHFHSHSHTATSQAVPQANTEPFRKGLVETRNWTVKTSWNQSTGPKWSQMMMDFRLTTWNLNLVLFYSIRQNININSNFIIFLLWKIVLSFVYNIFQGAGARIGTSKSISDGLGWTFCVERWKGRTFWA